MLSPWLIQLTKRSGQPSKNALHANSVCASGKRCTGIEPYSLASRRSTEPPECIVSHWMP